MLIESKNKKFQLTSKLETVWRDIGSRLGIEQDQLDSIRDRRKKNSVALRTVFKMWFDNAGSLPNATLYPLSWQGLYNLLWNVGRSTDADTYFELLGEKSK